MVTYIYQLPQELLLEIMGHVVDNEGVSGLAQKALVCRSWHQICEDNSLWRKAYYNTFHVNVAIEKVKDQYKRMIPVFKSFQGNLDNINSQGMNALHLATKDPWNRFNIIQTLLIHGMKPTSTTLGGLTALHTAVDHRNVTAVRILTDFDENLVKVTDYQGRTALHLAAGKGDYNMCVILLNCGSPPGAVDSVGQTPLHYAAKRGNVRVCRLLAPLYGRRNIELCDIHGNTALLLAATMNNEECMKVLIEEFYANMNVSDQQGRTIMHSVTRLMNHTTIKWINDHFIWENTAPSPHYTNENEEWDRIAARDQKTQFAKATTQLLVHYH